MMPLKGRVALITGAGSGIGRACALWLAGQGADLVVAGRSVAPLESIASEVRALGRGAIAVQADVANFVQVSEMADRALTECGRLDILINNAGHVQHKRFVDLTEADWDRMIAVHLKGAFNCTRAVIEAMMSSCWGRIINIASTAGLIGTPEHAHYSAANAGLIGFSKSLARDVASFGITVNVVAPGAIETPARAEVPDEITRFYVARTPMGRLGQPGEVAAIVAFLATEDASFITGQVISPNGGYFM